MDIISAKEAAEKWDIHIRMVQRYCMEGKIPGAKKYGNNWMIPKGAKKPRNLGKHPLRKVNSYSYPPCKVMTTVMPLTIGSEESISPIDGGDEIQLKQFYCELAYVRGDFELVKKIFAEEPEDSPGKFYSSSVAIAAAISTGDYSFYDKVDTFLKNIVDNNQNPDMAKVAELFLATAPVSMFAPEMAPSWLKDGDLRDIASEQKPFAFYLYTKYLQNTGQYTAMLSVAKTALALSAVKKGFTLLDIYLRILCACASCALNQRENGRLYLAEALELGMPYGFINPFAEHAAGFGGLLEPLLEQNYPNLSKTVEEKWQQTFQNWVSFHNRFAKKHVADILTLKEYHIAQLLANGETYGEAAKHMHMSLGALNNTVSVIYGKLFIQKKSELRDFLF